MMHTKKCSLGNVILLLLFIILYKFKNSDFLHFWGWVTLCQKYIVTFFSPGALLFHEGVFLKFYSGIIYIPYTHPF